MREPALSESTLKNLKDAQLVNIKVCLSSPITIDRRKMKLYKGLQEIGFDDNNLLKLPLPSSDKSYFKKTRLPELLKLFEIVPGQTIAYWQILKEEISIQNIISLFTKQENRALISIIFSLCLSSTVVNDVPQRNWQFASKWGLTSEILIDLLLNSNKYSMVRFKYLLNFQDLPNDLFRLEVFREAGFSVDQIITIINQKNISFTYLQDLFEFICIMKNVKCKIFPDFTNSIFQIINCSAGRSKIFPTIQIIFQSEELRAFITQNDLISEVLYNPAAFLKQSVTAENFQNMMRLKSTPLSRKLYKHFTPLELAPIFNKNDSNCIKVLEGLITTQTDNAHYPYFFQDNQVATYLRLLNLYHFTNKQILGILSQEKGDLTLTKCVKLVAFIYFKNLLLRTNWVNPIVKLANSADRVNHIDLLVRILTSYPKEMDQEHVLEEVCHFIATKTPDECRYSSPEEFRSFLYSETNSKIELTSSRRVITY